MTLAKLPLGESGVVYEVGGDREGLCAVGLTLGTAVTAVLSAPWGDMRAYFFGGSLIALRAKDAAAVKVRPCKDESRCDIIK